MRSFKDFKKGRKENSEFFSKYFSNKISPFLSYFFIKLKIKPNIISLLMIPSAIIGGFLINFDNNILKGIGVIFFLIINILDTSDGEVARYTKVFSKNGKFLDLFSQFIADNIFFISCFFCFEKPEIILFACILYNIFLYSKRIQLVSNQSDQESNNKIVLLLKTLGSNNFLYHSFFIFFMIKELEYYNQIFLLYWLGFSAIILLKITYIFKNSFSR